MSLLQCLLGFFVFSLKTKNKKTVMCSHLHIKKTWADPTASAWNSNVDDGIPVGAPWALIWALPSHLRSQPHFSSENALSLQSWAFAAFPFSSPCTFTEGHTLHWVWTERILILLSCLHPLKQCYLRFYQLYATFLKGGLCILPLFPGRCWKVVQKEEKNKNKKKQLMTRGLN